MDNDYGNWRKASYSNGSGDCVEVGGRTGNVTVRDTKNRDSGTLNLTADAWRAFTASLR